MAKSNGDNKKAVVKKTVAKVAPETKTDKPPIKNKVVVKKKKAAELPITITESVKVERKQLKVAQDAIYATGRRKESTAKVWLFKGTGQIRINAIHINDYLNSERLSKKVQLPLSILNLSESYDIRIDVTGGGLTGQAEAASLGVSRAVLSISEDFRPSLRSNGLLTQDRREKERKKYGKRGARKSPQFRKR